ncbi:MAG TPA: hypothetical protein VNJ02_18605 [Vicinamibacterales bacterium]|nr:hypothetical protein [Vicinamibacterales bacterium]
MLVVSVVIVLCSASADLSACGDKFLRAGRSAKGNRYAAVHPASILIYTPSASAKGLKEFESLLRKAGHKPVALKDGALLSQALTSATYDVVIAEYADSAIIKQQFRGSAEPGLLPILHNPTKWQEAEVAKHYQHVLQPEKMTKHDALDQIDQLMKQRRKPTAAVPPAR